MRAAGHGCSARCIAERMASDSLSLRICEAGGEGIAFAVLARARGERRYADLAGATAVKLLRGWFEGNLPYFFEECIDEDILRAEITERMLEIQDKVRAYSRRTRVGLRVDVAAALFAGGSYLITGFDGACALKISADGHELLYFSEESPGAGEFCRGEISGGDVYLLYTREIGEVFMPEELSAAFDPESVRDPLGIKMRLSNLTETCGHVRGIGNASAILVRFFEV